MTHTRNAPASRERSDGVPASDASGGPSENDRSDGVPAEGTEAEARRDADRSDGDQRSLRARSESMTVRPLRDGRYVVETDGGTYVVDLDDRSCTCPDHAIRGSRCKHLRRAAIEVTERRLPAPDQRGTACAVCGARLFVPRYEAGPNLCERHEHASGDLVRDRESGRLLVVTAATGERADEALTGEGRPVADYETNANYGDHEPVFEAVYLESLRVADVDALADEKRYSFPASRLAPVDDDRLRRPLDATPSPQETRQTRLPTTGAL